MIEVDLTTYNSSELIRMEGLAIYLSSMFKVEINLVEIQNYINEMTVNNHTEIVKKVNLGFGKIILNP